MEEALQSELDGAILFDRAALPQVSRGMFDPAFWGVSGENARGGRGTVWFVQTQAGAAVLRHYRRGGAVARISRDSYLWLGAERARSFAEFRLLAELQRRELPVPAPLAASYRRFGPTYRADLLMHRVADARSLAELLPGIASDQPALDSLGVTLARFHAAGVSHADLNAHNILRDRAGNWWLIDFDRGRLREPGGDWPWRKLSRLQRSWRKVVGLGAGEEPPGWSYLLGAHDRALAAFNR